VQNGLYCVVEHTPALASAYQLFWLLYCGKKLYVTNTAPAMKMRTPQVVQTRTSITPCECHSEKCCSKQGGRALKIRTVPKTAQHVQIWLLMTFYVCMHDNMLGGLMLTAKMIIARPTL